MIDEKRIAEIRDRCEKATPGPWRTLVLGNTVKSLQIISHSVCKKICSGISPKSQDADFIVHAREDIPYLLGEIESMQSENRCLSDWASQCEQTNEELICGAEKAEQELSEFQRRERTARECLNKIYERTRPGGIYGGYPYGSTTAIGSDVYDIVLDWHNLPKEGGRT